MMTIEDVVILRLGGLAPLTALIAAIVTGVFRGVSALMSTQTNFPVLSLGSG